MLKGSFIFAADLIRALHAAGLAPEVEFVSLSSYRDGTVSSGTVTILHDVESDVRGRDVLLVDDILESGRTLAYAKDLFAARGARRVLTCVLLEKPGKRAVRSTPISSASSAPTCSSSATAWTSRTRSGNCRSSACSRRKMQACRWRRIILIAEDEEALRALTARALTDSGHEVVTAVDGADALDILTREHGRFELLLTDIKMPLMDGIALALATARDHPAIIILLMTAYADQRERASNLDALIHDVILKPFTLAEIKAAVSDALRDGSEAVARMQRADGRRLRVRNPDSPARTVPPALRHGTSSTRRGCIRSNADRIRNPSTAARCSRARAAAAPDRRSACAALPGCGARAARRSRPAPSR